MDIFSDDFANIATFINFRWLFWRYQFACKRHPALTLKDVASLSGLNYCYLSRVCYKHASMSLERFNTVYQILYNDLLINGELNNA